MKTITATKEKINELTKGSALTMPGYIPEELNLYIEEIKKYFVKEDVNVFTFSGKDLNEAQSTNLPDDLNLFSIDLSDLKNIGTLAVNERMKFGFRWLDDIVDNDIRING